MPEYIDVIPAYIGVMPEFIDVMPTYVGVMPDLIGHLMIQRLPVKPAMTISSD